MASSAASSRAAASRTRGGGADSSRPRTMGVSSWPRFAPVNWRLTPSPPPDAPADPEAHVVEQHPPVRQHMADVPHLDMPPRAHARTIAVCHGGRQRYLAGPGMNGRPGGLSGDMSIELGTVGIWRHPSGLTPE